MHSVNSLNSVNWLRNGGYLGIELTNGPDEDDDCSIYDFKDA